MLDFVKGVLEAMELEDELVVGGGGGIAEGGDDVADELGGGEEVADGEPEGHCGNTSGEGRLWSIIAMFIQWTESV